MAARDLSAIAGSSILPALPRAFVETLSGTNGNIRRVTLPVNLGDIEVTLFARTQVAKWIDPATLAAAALAEDAAIGATEYGTVLTTGVTKFRFYARDMKVTAPVFALASATNSQVVEIQIDRLVLP